jgi:hypothetical protein
MEIDMHSAQSLCRRPAPSSQSYSKRPIYNAAATHGFLALGFLIVSLLACTGIYHGYGMIAVPGYDIEALCLMMICAAMGLCGLTGAVFSIMHVIRLGQGDE